MAVVALLAFMSPVIVVTLWLIIRPVEKPHRRLVRPDVRPED